ncbi:FAD-binding protein [Lactobacillus xujianguonis]|uniref:Urocanate reductase n=2 Tax=Lactobacillus xujianguonis TaxID=2495899 RepID=A0A437SW03_9LACO|nr:FAD-binding protein [Lactobacillus xujianguonis]RVU71111.1 FAD-binding protein [Lactobacillus xujianguonis]
MKMKANNNLKWNGNYDVIVLGFGGAGGTAARFAADNGAKVLLVDAAPYGHEGGNTRYSAQHVAMAHDKEKISKYFHQLAAPFAVSEKTMDTYLDGFVKMPEYFEKYLGMKPFIWSRDYQPTDHLAHKTNLCEYPEFAGSETFDFALVHNRDFDAGLWKVIRKNVLDRKNQIDIWLKSRATNLIQAADSDEVIGAVIERNHKKYCIHANKGVVLATGGFEDNAVMQQDYLHVTKLTPLGTLYNRGDGLKMAEEVGAQMWHMSNYESLGIVPSYVIAEGENERGRQISGWKNVKSGSIFAVADDGTRFMKEDAKFRHGHIYNHGQYDLPRAFDNAWLVFDQKQYNKFVEEKDAGKLKYTQLFDKIIAAEDIKSLAAKMNIPAENLAATLAEFNDFAKNGKDVKFDRAPQSMEAFAEGKVYAIKLVPAVLNTQGGPKHDENAQILNTQDQPIPHLYSAGELGGMCINRYQGGGNLAECLIFGKIAGENVARNAATVAVTVTDAVPAINDLADGERMDNIELGPDQYVASTEAGIGGKIVVRVTYKDHTIKNVEVLESHETEGIGAVAIKELPDKIVAANSTEIDAVSGASTTTRAVEEAVNKAIKQAK